MTLLASRSRRRRGQSLVEFTMVLPIILVLVLGAAEMGFAIGSNMGLEIATREGARVGAVLANGGGAVGCGAGQSPNAALVDPQIIAAVERSLTSPGANIDISKVDYIHIYKANADGSEALANTWTYSLGAGPTVGGMTLDFIQGPVNWPACQRDSTLPAPSIGVSVKYRYQMFTPMTVIMGLVGVHEINMNDSTIDALEPTQ